MPDNAHDLIDERLEAMEREITEIYTRTEAEIEKTADEYFLKFKKLDDQKRRQVEAGKLSEEEYLEWKKNKILYSKRFTEMKQQCAEQILNVNQTAVAYLNGKLPEMYALGYNDLKTAVDGIGGYTFTLISPDTVKRLITDNRSLLPLKKMNPAKDIPWNMKNINAEALQGILQGESMDKIAKRIRNVQEMNRTSAIRTARTAVTGAENKGRQDSYIRAERDGIVMKREWLATKDHRTRDAHAELDGQLRETDEPFENSLGEIMYPGDPNAHPSNVYNCRCTLKAKVLGFRKVNDGKGLTSNANSDKIEVEEYFQKKDVNYPTDRVPISQQRFEQLTIEARKNGAKIIRCNYGDEIYLHLEKNGATASCIGNLLIFRPDVTVSEVLEETYHFSQNIKQVNVDQPVEIRIIMNEIEAKEYIINNAKKYSVPRKEIEIIKSQLISYKALLKNLLRKD